MMRRRLGLTLGSVLVVAGGFTMSSAALALRARGDEGLGVIERARHATMQQPMTATVEVAWRDGEVLQTTRTTIVGDGQRLYAGSVTAGSAAYNDPSLSLAMPASDPKATQWPSPAVKYELQAVAGTPIAGRPTAGVEAVVNGAVRERWFVDAATGVLLQREVYTEDGTLSRRITAISVTMQAPTTPPTTAPAGPAVQGNGIQKFETPFVAPKTVGSGYSMVGMYKIDQDARQAFYSDGLRDVSVFQQRGDLMWDDLPAGGTDRMVDGVKVRTYASPIGCTWIWERNGVVFTAVSDSTPDEMPAIVGELRPPQPSAWDRFRMWVRDWFN